MKCQFAKNAAAFRVDTQFIFFPSESLWKPAATTRLLGKPEPEQKKKKKSVPKVILNQLSEFSAVLISIVGEDWVVLRKEQVIPRDGFSPIALFTLLSVDLALLLILSLENL